MFDPVVSKIIELLESQLDAERRQTGKVTIKVSSVELYCWGDELTCLRPCSLLEASETLSTSATSWGSGPRHSGLSCSFPSTR